jgi:two-component system nitrate/nitrite response regulator NarL
MPQDQSLRGETLQNTEDEQATFRAVVVDRDAMSGSFLAEALMREMRCQAIETSSAELLSVLGKGTFQIVIISADLKSARGSGLALSRAVSRTYPRISILIMFDQPTHESTLNAFQSGARGVFNRQGSKGEFIQCVERVRDGYIWVGREETGFLLEALRSIPSIAPLKEGNLSGLTSRELEVVRSAARGRTNKAIASELGLSEHTVKNYLFRAFDKLGVSSRVELLFCLTAREHAGGHLLPQRDKAIAAI